MLKLISSIAGPRGTVRAYLHEKLGTVKVLVVWGGPAMADVIHIETERRRRLWCEALSQVVDNAK
jgi:hypothetical protein